MAEIQKLQRDISNLMEESERIQNYNDIPECLKIIQLCLISKMIFSSRAKIDYLMDRRNCSPQFKAKNEFSKFVKNEIIELPTVFIRITE